MKTKQLPLRLIQKIGFKLDKIIYIPQINNNNNNKKSVLGLLRAEISYFVVDIFPK